MKCYVELDVEINPKGNVEVCRWTRDGSVPLLERSLIDLVKQVIMYNAFPFSAGFNGIEKVIDVDNEVEDLQTTLIECLALTQIALSKKRISDKIKEE